MGMAEKTSMSSVVKFTKLHEKAIMPSRGSAYAAGYDLYSVDNVILMPGDTKKINIGIALEIPNGYYGGIYARSGLATKQGLRLANSVGVIDSDYRGPIIVALHNDSHLVRSVSAGDRIAQLIISPYATVNFEMVESLSDTNRGEGGFGSTGVSK